MNIQEIVVEDTNSMTTAQNCQPENQVIYQGD
jgi:hypothetical protein